MTYGDRRHQMAIVCNLSSFPSSLYAISVSALPKEVTLPRSIADLPERLLLAGIYLPGTYRN